VRLVIARTLPSAVAPDAYICDLLPLGTTAPFRDHRRAEVPCTSISPRLAASIVLVLQRGDRVFPVVAAVASGIEALIAFRIIALSSAKFRIDVILPAVLVLATAICWGRATTKTAITAATLALAVGALQLLAAVGVLG
jgi:hypothetical protein